MNKFFDLDDETKKVIITQTSLQRGLPVSVIEKDLWVTTILQITFQLPFANKLLFKGGTSLSKVWNLIKRMSEDIDLAIDEHFDIFEGDSPTIKQIKRLRKASSLFVKHDFCSALKSAVLDFGLEQWCSIETQPDGVGDLTYPEPRKIYVKYDSLFPESFASINSQYVKPIVMLEVGARSLIEPTGSSSVKSFISQAFPNIDTDIVKSEIRTALPQKTYLEKVFLLHELFYTRSCGIADRKSRHMYDIERMMDEDFAKHAINDDDLWNSINHHRSRFTPVSGIDYSCDFRDDLILTPPKDFLNQWKEDYEYMRSQIIYDSKTLSFDNLVSRLHELENRFKERI